MAKGAIVSTLRVIISGVGASKTLRRRLTKILRGTNCSASQLTSNGGLILVAKRQHRGFKSKFVDVYATVGSLATGCPCISFICPVRLGPGIHGPVRRMFKRGLGDLKGVFFVRPLRCLDFIFLVRGIALILASDNNVRRRTPKLNGPMLIVHSAARHPRTLSTKAMGLMKASCGGVISRMSVLLSSTSTCRRVDGTVGPCNSKGTYVHVARALGIQLWLLCFLSAFAEEGVLMPGIGIMLRTSGSVNDVARTSV